MQFHQVYKSLKNEKKYDISLCKREEEKTRSAYHLIFVCTETGQTGIILAVNIIYVQTACSELYKSNKTTCPCSEGLVI